jgi:hypothetical protein
MFLSQIAQMADSPFPRAVRLQRRAMRLIILPDSPITVRCRMTASIDLGQAVITESNTSTVRHAGI